MADRTLPALPGIRLAYFGVLSPSQFQAVSIGRVQPSQKSKPLTGTSGNSEPSANTTSASWNGQTTCAFVTIYPPSINTPFPSRVAVSTKAIDEATDGNARSELSRT